MEENQDAAKRYRQCADQARAMADRTLDGDIAYLLTSIAAGYEQMAEIEDGISLCIRGSERDRPANEKGSAREAGRAF